MVAFDTIVDLVQRCDFKQETLYACTSLLDHTLYQKRYTLSPVCIFTYYIQ